MRKARKRVVTVHQRKQEVVGRDHDQSSYKSCREADCHPGLGINPLPITFESFSILFTLTLEIRVQDDAVTRLAGSESGERLC
jgi:hypothetical protein